MAATKPTLVVFLGDLGASPVERLVGGARWAAAFDSIEAALSTGSFDGAVLVTDELPEGTGLPDGVLVDESLEDFHFGRRLAGVIRDHSLTSIVYMGGGSVPLFGAADFACIGDGVRSGLALTNNRYSSDLVAFTVTAGTHGAIATATRDNALARVLAESAGIQVDELPRTVESVFDIDAPTDLAVLKLSGRGGPRLHRHLAAQGLEVSQFERVLPLFLDTQKQLVIAGRVGSHTWRYLETETACRVRLFSEERGMEADGRAESGAARSLLGFVLDEVGPGRLFDMLRELGDAALLDTRVLVAHAGAFPSRQDRFQSDLFQIDEIENPYLRGLTQAALEAPIPVLLGGHSLMSGALMLLNETAWRLRDNGKL